MPFAFEKGSRIVGFVTNTGRATPQVFVCKDASTLHPGLCLTPVHSPTRIQREQHAECCCYWSSGPMVPTLARLRETIPWGLGVDRFMLGMFRPCITQGGLMHLFKQLLWLLTPFLFNYGFLTKRCVCVWYESQQYCKLSLMQAFCSALGLMHPFEGHQACLS